MRSSFVKTRSGIFASGRNKNFEIGLREQADIQSFQKLEIEGEIADFKVGDSHLIVLKESHQLLVSGKNNFCQLGLS